jgi:hypothetical protein
MSSITTNPNAPCDVCGRKPAVYNFFAKEYQCIECFGKWLAKFSMIGMTIAGLIYFIF